jgi:hypothetical protein
LKTKISINLCFVHLLRYIFQYHKAPAGSHDKLEAKKRLMDEISYRKHVEYSINHIVMLLFGNSNSSSILLDTVRPPGQPLVDDWDCFKMLVGPPSFLYSIHLLISASNGVHHDTHHTSLWF